MDEKTVTLHDDLGSQADMLSGAAALIGHLQHGKDGIAAASRQQQALMERLPLFASDYLYPWYCLLVALSSDVLHGFTVGSPFFTLSPSEIIEVLNRARYAQHLFNKNEPLEPFGAGVGEFLEQAKAMFVRLCWFLMDPDKYDNSSTEDSAKLKDLFDAIADSNVHKKVCESIYYDLSAAFGAGQSEPSGILESITLIELGDEWLGVQR